VVQQVDSVTYKYTDVDSPKKSHLWLLWFLLIPIVLGILGAGYYYLTYVQFPKPTGLIENKFTWEYQSQSYTMEVPLYQSIENYYNKQPKGIYVGMENSSLNKYFNLPKQDQEVASVASEIKSLAVKSGLDSDQTAELAVSFVQSIPYDNARAKTDLTHPWYPYETLFANQGICSDKTILMVAILRKLGYGGAAFMYENQQHMAAAIECPKNYSNYNSGYCIVETTAIGDKIGIIPEINHNLVAVQRSAAQAYGQTSDTQNIQLTNPKIVAETPGTTYSGVIQTIENENQINQLSAYFVTQKAAISSKEASINQLKSQLDAYNAASNVSAYNSLVPTYNNLVDQVQAMISDYNSKVDLYNSLITQ
jgi:hypothetical protein